MGQVRGSESIELELMQLQGPTRWLLLTTGIGWMPQLKRAGGMLAVRGICTGLLASYG